MSIRWLDEPTTGARDCGKTSQAGSSGLAPFGPHNVTRFSKPVHATDICAVFALWQQFTAITRTESKSRDASIRSSSAAAAFLRFPHVAVTCFCRCLLDLRVNLAADKNGRACQIQPQQKGDHCT
jgi:hypothetical protein